MAQRPRQTRHCRMRRMRRHRPPLGAVMAVLEMTVFIV